MYFCIVYVYFYTCTSSLAAAILDIPMHSNTNNKEISPAKSSYNCQLQLVDSVPSKMVRVSVFQPPSWICSRKQLPVMMHIAQLSREPLKTWV